MKPFKTSVAWWIFSSLTLALMSGCAGAGQSGTAAYEETAQSTNNDIRPARAVPASAHSGYSELPAYELDGAGFYRLLISELALLNEQPDVALFLLGEAHEQYPQDPQILARVAPLAAQMGDLELALSYFQRWTEVAPEKPDAWHGVWQLAFVSRDSAIAISALESLLERAPGYGIYIPFELLAEWDNPALKEFYRRVEQSDLPTISPDIQLMQGYTAKLLGEPALAEKHWRTLASGLDSKTDYFSYGQTLANLEVNEGARIVLKAGTNKFSAEPGLYVLLAQAHLQEGDGPAALTVLEQGLQQRADNTDLLRFAGELAFEQQQNETAASYFNHLLHTSEADAGYYYLGRLAERANEPRSAFGYYEEVVDDNWVLEATQRILDLLKNPALADVDSESLFAEQVARFPSLKAELSELQGYYYYDKQKYQRAYDAFSVGLSTDPQNINLLYMRALAAEPLDRLNDLESDLRQILHYDPNNTAALNALGFTLLDRTERIDEAAAMIEQAHAQNPNSYAITDSLGWLRFKQGNYAKAVDILGQALEMQGWEDSNDEVVTHYVEALWQNDQQSDAMAVAERWLEQNQSSERLRSLLSRLQETP